METAIVVANAENSVTVTSNTFDTSILAGGKSPNTIEQYRIHWTAYVAYAGTWQMAVQPATLARWRQHLLETGYTLKDGTLKDYTVNAINLRLASVRSVIAAAAEQGYVDHATADAFKVVRGLKQKANKERRRENNRTPITRTQMDDICNAPNIQTGAGLMHRAFLLTMRGTGARITDVVSMKVGDITPYTNDSNVTGWAVKFQGKNEAEPVTVEISKTAKAAIDAWLEWRNLAGVQSDFVFTSFTGRGDRDPSGKPISRVSAWEMVQRYAKRVGLEHIKPHDFRRYVGTQLAKKDIRLAQKQLRHKRIETTAQNYVLDDVHMGNMDAI
jgi:integrase